MKPKIRTILEECIEKGIARGYARAHKHTEKPHEGFIFLSIQECVMDEIYNYLAFDEND